MKKKGSFICFVGIDGSGKTTLANALIENAQAQGIKIEYTWCKFESSVFKFLIWLKNLFLVREKDWKRNYEQSLTIKKGLFQKPLARAVYEWFVLISYWFQVVRKVYVPLRLGRNVVSDRYVYDTVVDLAVDLDYADQTVATRLRQILSLTPRPDLIFYVNVPEQTAFERKDDVPSIQFLRQKKDCYARIVAGLDKTILDGSKPLAELRETVVRRGLEPFARGHRS
jgi:dTMP kinase